MLKLDLLVIDSFTEELSDNPIRSVTTLVSSVHWRHKTDLIMVSGNGQAFVIPCDNEKDAADMYSKLSDALKCGASYTLSLHSALSVGSVTTINPDWNVSGCREYNEKVLRTRNTEQ